MELNFTHNKNEFGKCVNEIFQINKPQKHKYEIRIFSRMNPINLEKINENQKKAVWQAK